MVARNPKERRPEMKREIERVGAERETVKELASEDLRHVLGGADIPTNPQDPVEDDGCTGRDFFSDPRALCLK
jgi:hypothetical protein